MAALSHLAYSSLAGMQHAQILHLVWLILRHRIDASSPLIPERTATLRDVRRDGPEPNWWQRNLNICNIVRVKLIPLRPCIQQHHPACWLLLVTRATKPDLIAETVLEAPHCWHRRCIRRVAESRSSRVSTLLQPGHSTYLQGVGQGRLDAAACGRGGRRERESFRAAIAHSFT